MTRIYRIPNRQAAETMAIQKLIRASNAENIVRRRSQDKADREENARRIGAVSTATIISLGA